MQGELLESVHEFWFGEQRAQRTIPPERIDLWFGSSADTDALIAERFGALIEEAAEAEWDLDELTPNQQLGLVILLDQFPRNVFRGTARAYRHDAKAREIAAAMAEDGLDLYSPIEKMFAMLPFGHSEDAADQERAYRYFVDEIAPNVPGDSEFWKGALKQATLYRDVINRFGRFPQRNDALGRASTAEEEQFLAEGGMG